MPKPWCVILHPKDWATGGYKGRMRYRHVEIGAPVPRKRNGVPTYDGYADMATDEGKAKLLDTVSELKPAWFLFWIHGNFGPSDLAKIKRASPQTKIAMWFGNHRPVVAGNVKKVQRWLHAVLLNSRHPAQYKIYRKAGFRTVGTLWDGFAPDEEPLQETRPTFDCTFAGETYLAASTKHHKLDFPGGKLRLDFIRAVNDNFKLGVYSAFKGCWAKANSRKPFHVMPEVYHPLHLAALRRGRITLNTNHFPDFRQAYTRRTIRSIFARRCHVTLHIPGMEEHFENHKHLVWFKTIPEGVDLIRYYLDHDEERERIAWAGWRLACEKFTFEHRMRDFERVVLDKEGAE